MQDTKPVQILPVANLDTRLLEIKDIGYFCPIIWTMLHDRGILPECMDFKHCLVNYSRLGTDFGSRYYSTFISGLQHDNGVQHKYGGRELTSRDAARAELVDLIQKYLALPFTFGYDYAPPYTILTTPRRVDLVVGILSDYPNLDVQIAKTSKGKILKPEPI